MWLYLVSAERIVQQHRCILHWPRNGNAAHWNKHFSSCRCCSHCRRCSAATAAGTSRDDAVLQLESSSCVVLLCFNRCIVISLAGNAHFAHLPLPPLLLLLQLQLLLLLCCCGCNCKNSGCCCSECCCGVVGDAIAVVVVAVCGNEHTQHIAQLFSNWKGLHFANAAAVAVAVTSGIFPLFVLFVCGFASSFFLVSLLF